MHYRTMLFLATMAAGVWAGPAAAINIFEFDGACFRQCSFFGLSERQRLDGALDFLDSINTEENSTFNHGFFPVESFSFLGETFTMAEDQRPIEFSIQNGGVRFPTTDLIDFVGHSTFDRVLFREIPVTDAVASKFGVDHLFSSAGRVTEVTFATVDGPVNTTVYSAIGRFVRAAPPSEDESGGGSGSTGSGSAEGSVPVPGTLALALLGGCVMGFAGAASRRCRLAKPASTPSPAAAAAGS